MVQVIQYVNQVFSSNTYVVHEEGLLKDVWLIDVGDVDRILENLPTTIVRGVFITHSHFDHIYGINRLLKRFPQCTIYASESAKEGLYSAKKNFSYYHGNPIVCIDADVRIMQEGDEINLTDSGTVVTYETPGHDSGCLSYKIANYLFTGDSFIPGFKVVTKLKGGNQQLAMESVRRIQGLLTKGIVLCPGHGNIQSY